MLDSFVEPRRITVNLLLTRINGENPDGFRIEEGMQFVCDGIPVYPRAVSRGYNGRGDQRNVLVFSTTYKPYREALDEVYQFGVVVFASHKQSTNQDVRLVSLDKKQEDEVCLRFHGDAILDEKECSQVI